MDIATVMGILVFLGLVTWLSNTVASRFGTFTFFVVIADATGMGLFAFLA